MPCQPSECSDTRCDLKKASLWLDHEDLEKNHPYIYSQLKNKVEYERKNGYKCLKDSPN